MGTNAWNGRYDYIGGTVIFSGNSKSSGGSFDGIVFSKYICCNIAGAEEGKS